MKKLLWILVLGLLLSGNAYAGLFSKDKIKVTKCWDSTEFKNYKEQKKDRAKHGMTKWEWELNLKEKIAYRIVERNGQLQINQFKIIISTDDYIIAHDPAGDYQFDLNNESFITTFQAIKVQLVCKFK